MDPSRWLGPWGRGRVGGWWREASAPAWPHRACAAGGAGRVSRRQECHPSRLCRQLPRIGAERGQARRGLCVALMARCIPPPAPRGAKGGLCRGVLPPWRQTGAIGTDPDPWGLPGPLPCPHGAQGREQAITFMGHSNRSRDGAASLRGTEHQCVAWLDVTAWGQQHTPRGQALFVPGASERGSSIPSAKG